MVRSWFSSLLNRPSRPPSNASRRRGTRLHVEPLEDRCVPVVTPVVHASAFTEGVSGTATIAGFTDSDNVTAANFTNVSINWGDGSAADTTTGSVSQPIGGGEFLISGSHSYGEEGTFPVVVTLHDVLNNVNRSITLSSAAVADAPLLPGNPLGGVTHATFQGVGGSNASGPALSALNAFKAALGGTDNGATPAPQSGGFRKITWDGVKLDGTDFNGGDAVIVPNKVVGIPINRFQNVGVIFEEVYAVSGDGFVSVNSHVNGLFPAFSPSNTFAMFNENSIGMSFVLPSSPDTTPVPAATTGFGAIFLNVRTPNATSIEYFDGDQSLGKFFVTAGQQGEAEFLGVNFSSPVVTRVEITLGTDVIFSFDGTAVRQGGADAPPDHNLVDTDDFVHAEPVPPGGDQAAVHARAQVAFTGTVATFHDLDAHANVHDFTATIDWGDGHRSAGTVVANAAGGFDVQGANAYGKAGTFPISVLVQDLGGSEVTLSNTAAVTKTGTSTVLSVSPRAAAAGQPLTLTAKVLPAQGGGVPTGTVTFLDNGKAVGRASLDASGRAVLTRALPDGVNSVVAVYGGDGAFDPSNSAAQAATVNPDVTRVVRLTLGPVASLGGGLFRQHVTVVDVSGHALPGPVALVLDHLPPGVRLLNARGRTRFLKPLGSPFLLLPGVAAGHVLNADLLFLGPDAGLIHFTPCVLAGTARV